MHRNIVIFILGVAIGSILMEMVFSYKISKLDITVMNQLGTQTPMAIKWFFLIMCGCVEGFLIFNTKTDTEI